MSWPLGAPTLWSCWLAVRTTALTVFCGYGLLWCLLVQRHPFALAVRSFVRKALLAELTVTVSSGVQNVIFSAGFLGGLFQSHQSRHRTSRPPQPWAPRLADRFRCRQVHHDACRLQSALAPSCATLLIPTVQDTSGAAFSTPLARNVLAKFVILIVKASTPHRWPRRITFLPWAVLDRLVPSGVAPHARD